MRLVEASEPIWLGLWSADVPARGRRMLQGQFPHTERLIHVPARALGFGFSPCGMLGKLLRAT